MCEPQDLSIITFFILSGLQFGFCGWFIIFEGETAEVDGMLFSC